MAALMIFVVAASFQSCSILCVCILTFNIGEGDGLVRRGRVRLDDAQQRPEIVDGVRELIGVTRDHRQKRVGSV